MRVFLILQNDPLKHSTNKLSCKMTYTPKIGVYKKPNKLSDRFVRFYQENFWSKPIIPNKPITKKMLGMRRKKI